MQTEQNYNLRAEKSLLGVLINRDADISDLRVTEEDFYVDVNKQIFKACKELGKYTNFISIQDKLGSLNDVVYINDCTALAMSTTNYKYFEDQIIIKSKLRKQAMIANEILNNVANGIDSIDLFKKADEIDNYDDGEMVFVRDIVSSELESIELYNDGKIEPGLMTKIKGLDYYANGLVNGDLIYMGARPSMGKSALAMQIALNVAETKKVGIFSLEMQNSKIVRRMLVNQSRVHLNLIKTKQLAENEIRRLTNACAKLFNENIAISDKGNQSVLEIHRKAKRHQKKYGLDLLIIDHFHLLKASISGSNYEKRSHDSQLLKELAKDLNIPVICLCQLSRSLEARRIEDRMPILSDLKETGSLEQDGDLIMFINRDDYWHKNEKDWEQTNQADISIAKNRDGETGMFKLNWNGGTQRFENI